MTIEEAISVLKSEIERYESLEHTEESRTLAIRLLGATRECRDYLYWMLVQLKEYGPSAHHLVQEAWEELHIPDCSVLKPVWALDGDEFLERTNGAYRRNKIREMSLTKKARPPEKAT